ncbi:LamG-like jellyroll fold domain-containing protein [Lentimicrobium sp. S6]|uniref:LamG-like jellyroll fold domain-containing protein n=1 Tax=Lentimicrobium sp. S6 TaxID=2735872 RepID=UPI0015526B7F|nr:LamG-like jellyroll fold domain-containing protein [Lentimicrobium sp. S6]NPD47755.1 T9SS type A sorting domain-containing protein [Lentimicrobium sp. S6]
MKKNFYTLIILTFFGISLSSTAQNNALTFSSDVISIPSNMGLGTINITAECWINLPSLTESGTFINIGGGSNGYAIGVGSGDFEHSGNELILIYDNIRWIPTGINIGTDWHHVAFSIDLAGTARAFLDGTLVFTSPGSGPSAPSTNTFIGASDNLGGRPLTDGIIDEVRIWNVALDQSNIRTRMYQELIGNEDNLVAYYKFNQTSGTTLYDETANNYNGTLLGINFTDHAIPSSAFFGPKNCYSFNGSISWVSLGNDPYHNNFSGGTAISIEYWFKGSVLQSAVRFQGFDVSYGSDYVVAGWGGSNPKFIISTDGGSANGVLIGSDAVLEDGNWHHIACTWEKNTTNGFKTYVDGVLSNQRTSANVNLPTIVYNGLLGAYHGPSEVLNGQLDEVRIWTDVRSEAEIRENMNKTLIGNEDGLVMYYNLDNGNVANNIASANYDGAPANITSVVSTAFNTWLNTSSNSESTNANWSRGIAPSDPENDIVDNVGVYAFSGSDPIVSTAFDCNLFFLETGASFTLNDGASFIAQGNEFINGTFTLNKTLTNDSKWHLISAPNNNTTANLFFGDYLQNWNESTGLWEQIDDENTTLTPVKAYGFFGTHAKASYSFTGDPNDGDQSISLTTSGSGGSYNKANAVGNPYPSAIDWDLVSGYGAKYTWNGTAYEAYPATGGFGLAPRYAAPCQGFFVLPSSSGTFTLTNSMRTHDGADGFEKAIQTIENGIIVYTQSNGYKDKLVIAFKEESSDNFELDKDAYKILSNTENLSQIYSLSNYEKLSIDIRPETEIVQLGFQNTANGKYSIGMLETDGIASAELEDTKLHTFHDLSTGIYVFDWNMEDSEERFILHLKATATNELVEQEAQVYSSNGRVYIRQTSSNEFNSVVIYDLAGRVVYSSSLSQQELQSISLSNAKGAYLVQLVSDNETIVQKVVLK